jgi:hypothetical protein
VFHGVSIGGLPLHVVFQIKHVVIVTLKLVLQKTTVYLGDVVIKVPQQKELRGVFILLDIEVIL